MPYACFHWGPASFWHKGQPFYGRICDVRLFAIDLGNGLTEVAIKLEEEACPLEGKTLKFYSKLETTHCGYFFYKLYPITVSKRWSLVLLKINRDRFGDSIMESS